MIRSGSGLVAAGVALVAAGSCAGVATAADRGPERVFQYADERIVESSGLAASALHRDVLYTHNDSDESGRVFAVDMQGRTVAVLTLAGVEARDWEGIAIGSDDDGRSAVFVGDIGDNLLGAWPEIWVYRFAEPEALTNASVEATRFRFRYEDGARNAEALLVDPRDNRIYVVSKEAGGAGIYQAPAGLSATEVNVLTRIADAPSLVTDGAFAPSGQRFVLRDYLTARTYDRPGGEVDSLALPIAAQGEAITYTRDGTALLSGSEGAGSAVWRVPVTGPNAEAEEEPAEQPGDAAGEDGGDGSGVGDGDGAGIDTDEVDAPVLWGNLLGLAAAAAAFFGLYHSMGRRLQKARKRKK